MKSYELWCSHVFFVIQSMVCKQVAQRCYSTQFLPKNHSYDPIIVAAANQQNLHFMVLPPTYLVSYLFHYLLNFQNKTTANTIEQSVQHFKNKISNIQILLNFQNGVSDYTRKRSSLVEALSNSLFSDSDHGQRDNVSFME